MGLIIRPNLHVEIARVAVSNFSSTFRWKMRL